MGGGVGDGGEDIFADQVWMGFEDLVIAVAGREIGENVGDANAKATQAGTSAALFGVDGDAVESVDHGLILRRLFSARLH